MSEQQKVLTILHWKNKKIIIRIVIAVFLLLTLFIMFITLALIFHWDLAMLINSPKKTVTTEIVRSPQEKVTITEEGKTLWDWLQLLGVLAIPVVVGFGTAFFTIQQAKNSEANTESQQQEQLLRTYFNKISDLLLDEKLNTNPNIQSIVRSRTLAALHILNTQRKAIVLQFLNDSNLLQYVKCFLYALDLSNTDLNRIGLDGAHLNEAHLNGTRLNEAHLSGANLSRANLSRADLSEADLSEADLSEANLSEANLSGANLSGAGLSEANLSGASLGGADLIGAGLGGADLFKADLIGADLRRAFLGGANLFRADLREADLRGADLRRADLRRADLRRANITPEQLEEARNITSEQLAQIRPSNPETQ